MSNVGFTGTRFGMTSAQLAAVEELLDGMDPGRAHHGDCIGADEQFHAMARSRGWWMVGHPPVDPAHQACCVFDELRPAYAHLRRNCNIVDEADLMIATPRELQEQLNGGTWFTIRRTRKKLKALMIVLPSGIVVREWP